MILISTSAASQHWKLESSNKSLEVHDLGHTYSLASVNGQLFNQRMLLLKLLEMYNGLNAVCNVFNSATYTLCCILLSLSADGC